MFSNTPFDKLLLKSPISSREKKQINPIALTPKPSNSYSTQYKSYTSVKSKN
jgi:hypothetical protein